jgi:hypothetical protein
MRQAALTLKGGEREIFLDGPVTRVPHLEAQPVLKARQFGEFKEM